MENRPSWMKGLAEEFPSFAERPLSEIALPGSHDAASHGITHSSPMAPDSDAWARNLAVIFGKSIVQTKYAPWAKCQSYDIFSQLVNGVRYFDFRVCYVDEQLWLCHGLLSVPLSGVLEEICRFVREIGRDEVLLLDFQRLCFQDEETHALLLGMVQSMLGEWICPGFARTCRVTLSELWKSPERILVLYGDSATVENYPWLWNRSELVDSPWHNTTENSVLLERMTATWKEWKSDGEARHRFTVTQSQRSPDKNMTMASQFSAGSSGIKGVFDLAERTHSLVCDWLEERHRLAADSKEWSGVNIVIADFVDLLDGKLVDSVIKMNMPQS